MRFFPGKFLNRVIPQTIYHANKVGSPISIANVRKLHQGELGIGVHSVSSVRHFLHYHNLALVTGPLHMCASQLVTGASQQIFSRRGVPAVFILFDFNQVVIDGVFPRDCMSYSFLNSKTQSLSIVDAKMKLKAQATNIRELKKDVYPKSGTMYFQACDINEIHVRVKFNHICGLGILASHKGLHDINNLFNQLSNFSSLEQLDKVEALSYLIAVLRFACLHNSLLKRNMHCPTVSYDYGNFAPYPIDGRQLNELSKFWNGELHQKINQLYRAMDKSDEYLQLFDELDTVLQEINAIYRFQWLDIGQRAVAKVAGQFGK